MENVRVQRQTTHQVMMGLIDVDETFATGYGSSFGIRPRNLVLRWEFDSTSGWRLRKASLAGPHVKRDGTLGLRRGFRDFERDGTLTEDAPQWLRDLEALYRPSGVVLVP